MMRNVMMILFTISSIMLTGTCRELELEQAGRGDALNGDNRTKLEYM